MAIHLCYVSVLQTSLFNFKWIRKWLSIEEKNIKRTVGYPKTICYSLWDLTANHKHYPENIQFPLLC